MNRYTNKVCLVTAASAGIGLATAQRFAGEGGIVIICSRKQKNVDEAVAQLKAFKVEGYQCNVGKAEERLKLTGYKYPAETFMIGSKQSGERNSFEIDQYFCQDYF